VYYPEITQKLEQYAKEHNLPYKKASLFGALHNHYKLIKANGTGDFNIWEESM
jgi:linoleoyl-CoA desaturase